MALAVKLIKAKIDAPLAANTSATGTSLVSSTLYTVPTGRIAKVILQNYQTYVSMRGSVATWYSYAGRNTNSTMSLFFALNSGISGAATEVSALFTFPGTLSLAGSTIINVGDTQIDTTVNIARSLSTVIDPTLQFYYSKLGDVASSSVIVSAFQFTATPPSGRFFIGGNQETSNYMYVFPSSVVRSTTTIGARISLAPSFSFDGTSRSYGSFVGTNLNGAGTLLANSELLYISNNTTVAAATSSTTNSGYVGSVKYLAAGDAIALSLGATTTVNSFTFSSLVSSGSSSLSAFGRFVSTGNEGGTYPVTISAKYNDNSSAISVQSTNSGAVSVSAGAIATFLVIEENAS